MPGPTDPKEAAQIAKELSGELRAAFDRVLREHKVTDWHLQSFTLRRGVAFESECPPGEDYDCRWIGGNIVCKCFPKL
jgi:hypothetical protein